MPVIAFPPLVSYKDAARRKQQVNGSQPSQVTATTTSYYPVTPSPYSQPMSSQQNDSDRRGNNNNHASAASGSHHRNPYAKPSNVSGVPSNPYSRSSNHEGNRNKGDGSTWNSNMGREWNSLERQHPHRVGRIRVDRQFSTALEIMSTAEESQVQNPTWSGVVDSTAPVSSSNSQTTTSRNLPQPTSLAARLDDLDDSDDSDDELLSFVAFSK